MHRHADLEDSIPFWFAANDTSGSGADGSTPLYDVRLGGASGTAAPVYSGTPTLLSHADYPDGCYECYFAAGTANGFAAGSTYGVFATLAADGQNPTGFIGSFTLDPIPANATQWLGNAVTAGIGNRPAVDSQAVSGSVTAADNMEAAALVIVTGTAAAGTLSVTQMTSDLSEATDDHYIGRVIIWTGGNLLGQATDITDYAGTNGLLTFTAVTEAPQAGDTFIIV